MQSYVMPDIFARYMLFLCIYASYVDCQLSACVCIYIKVCGVYIIIVQGRIYKATRRSFSVSNVSVMLDLFKIFAEGVCCV